MRKTKILMAFIGIFLTTEASVKAFEVPSEVERKVCLTKGEYAVFARHPLFWGAWYIPGARSSVLDQGNIELSHEHIFFCKDGFVTDNIGFGPSGRFKYSQLAVRANMRVDGGRINDFSPIDSKRYDSNVIRQVLAGVTNILPDRCELKRGSDGIYLGVVNNCQGFTKRVREDYDKLVKPEITQISCNVCNSVSGRSGRFSFTYKDRNDDALRWEISYQQNPNAPVFSGNLKDCEARKSDSCGGVGASTISYSVTGMGGNCKQNNKQDCVHRLQLVVIDKEGNRSKPRPFTLRIASQ